MKKRVISEKKKAEAKAKRSALKTLSEKLAPLVASGKFEKLNDAIIDHYQSQTGGSDFRTFKDWRDSGKQVRKGEKGFLVWGKPRKLKGDEGAKDEGAKDEEKDSGSFHPVVTLFHDGQVDDAGKAKPATGKPASVKSICDAYSQLKKLAPQFPSFFPTPEKVATRLARELVQFAGLESIRDFKGIDVLDSSCGAGHLLAPFGRAGANCFGIEFSPTIASYAQRLLPSTASVCVGDSLESNLFDRAFDCVVINPPFERKKGIGSLAIAHFIRAYDDLLSEGGVIAMIAPTGVFDGSTRQAREAKERFGDRLKTVDLGAVFNGSDAIRKTAVKVSIFMLEKL